MKIGKTEGFYVDVYARHKGVTGSCFLNSVHWPDGKNVRFLVDAGATQGKDNNGFYNSFFPFNTGKISFIILTHGHHDHQGLLPVVVRQGFHGPIFTHYATANLMTVSLYDSCKIAEPFTNVPLCTQNEVEKTLDLVVGCTTKKIMKPDKNIRIVFYTNGHLVGAVLTLVVISCPGEEDINLIYTGDYKDNNIFFNVEMPPKQVRELNISAFFCESTYGDVDSTNSMFEKCLEKNTVQALREGKTVIYPAFAQGRYQEVLYHIKMWKKKGIIPESTPVFADGGTSHDFKSMYMYQELGIKKLMKNFVPKGTRFVPKSRERQSYRKDIMDISSPKIIIAPGGMGSYGPIKTYIDYYLSKSDALIHMLGYCSPDSKGYQLLNTPRGETVSYNGRNHTIACDIKKTAEMSGHAQRNKLLNLIKWFPNTQSIVINHGDEETKTKFREYLLDNLSIPEDEIVIAAPETAYRIRSNGITDELPTYFESIL